MSELPLNQIICGDCLSVMRDFPDGCVDLVLTDPPYNIGCDYDTYDDNRDRDDYDRWIQSWWDALPSQRRIVFPGVGNLSLWYKRNPTATACWYKPGAPGRANPFQWCEWEPILTWKCMFRLSDVFRATISKQKGVGSHPCPKPLPLMVDIIKRLRSKCDIILDPFCGSGTVCLAAKMAGKNFIGIDISEDYCRIARERLKQDAPLFQGVTDG